MTHETPKEIARRIRRGKYRPIFRPAEKKPGDLVIDARKAVAA